MSGLLLAARYLTIIPLPGGRHGPSSRLGRAVAWFPVVGLGLGALLAAADWLTARWFSPLLAALLTVTAWKLLTGGLHLDGLADCLDGLAGRDREQRLAIMRDSRIGTFGAVGLILFLMLELVTVAEAAATWRWRALLVIPAIGRAAPPLLARWFPPARADGQGAAFAGGVGVAGALLAVVIAAAAAVAVLGAGGFVAALSGMVAALAAGRFFAGRLGGLTGDVLGAGVEVAELVALLAVLAWTGSRA